MASWTASRDLGVVFALTGYLGDPTMITILLSEISLLGVNAVVSLQIKCLSSACLTTKPKRAPEAACFLTAALPSFITGSTTIQIVPDLLTACH